MEFTDQNKNNKSEVKVILRTSFIYVENGEEKSSIEEHERRVEILKHNQELIKRFSKKEEKIETC